MPAPRVQRRKRRLAIWGACILAGIGLTFVVWPIGLCMILCALIMLRHRQGVPVLVYHSVSPAPDWLPWAQNISVRPDVFAAQMRHLAQSKWEVVASSSLLDGTAPRHAVVLQFDDGYLDFLIAAAVLKRFNLPATVFVSSNFIDPSDGVRSPEEDWRGYLNADELRALDADPLFEIASHGADHERIAVSHKATERDNSTWGLETAYLWSLRPGNKSRWYETVPPDCSRVPDNESALCANAWICNRVESDAERDARVTDNLTSARKVLSDIVHRDVRFLCWPFDRVTAAAERSATQAGFFHWTGGLDDNPFGTPVTRMSRTHINDSSAGGGPVWLEVLVFRARLEVASGNLLWWPITLVARLVRARRFKFLHGPIAQGQSS